MRSVQESWKVPRWVERMREAGYDVRIGTDTRPLSPVPDAMFPPPGRWTSPRLLHSREMSSQGNARGFPMGEVLRSLARPFMEGMARGFDLLGAYNRRAPDATVSPAEADRRAFASGWEAVGADLRAAVDALEAERAGSHTYA